jgi:two-component system response regulator ChvI
MTVSLDQNPESALPASPVVALAGVSNANAICVLLVEGDQIFREILSDELSERRFVIRSFGDGASLLDSLATAGDADVIILDWSLPKPSGIDLLLQLRRHGVNLPVVFLTGRGLPAHESLALDRGASDSIDKARGIEVLVRRLTRAVGAGKTAADPQTDKHIVRGKLVLELSVSRAYWDGGDLGLTVGEYNIVHLLVSNVGRYVTYRAIYDRLHYEGFIAGSGNDGYRANVRSAIKRIRNKFRDLDPSFAAIENYSSFGYCWGKQADAS